MLILLSVLVVACGGGAGANGANLGDPQATMTIQIGGNQGSPTPALPGEWCGAWVTNPTPSYGTGTIAVYAKFTKNVNGNPAGIGGATATAHVMWTPGDIETYSATTTSDGLAVFTISAANKSYAVNTITLVTVTFQGSGMECTVDQDRAAFFTLIYASPTTSGKNTPTPKQNGTPTSTPSSQGGATPTVTIPATPPLPTPTGTVKPGH
ncbi:MAG: hypothetical protein JO215_12480 [Ktedonobacteraceae bacterium]|nr:hypothetical protein [Ktedonobacteraceae bacterium]